MLSIFDALVPAGFFGVLAISPRRIWTRRPMATGRNHNTRRGSAMLEFSLAFGVFFAMLLGLFDFAMPMFFRTGLHHSVRVATRYAITGQTKSGMGHDASIKDEVKTNSFGLIGDGDLDLITIQYYDPTGAETADNAAGNMVAVSVANFPVPRIGPIMWSSAPLAITVLAVDRMEPFLVQPPR